MGQKKCVGRGAARAPRIRCFHGRLRIVSYSTSRSCRRHFATLRLPREAPSAGMQLRCPLILRTGPRDVGRTKRRTRFRRAIHGLIILARCVGGYFVIVNGR